MSHLLHLLEVDYHYARVVSADSCLACLEDVSLCLCWMHWLGDRRNAAAVNLMMKPVLDEPCRPMAGDDVSIHQVLQPVNHWLLPAKVHATNCESS